MSNCSESFRHAATAVVLLALSACSSQVTRPSAPRVSASSPAAAVATVSAAAPELAKGDPDQRFQEALGLMKARQFPQAQAAFLALARDYPRYSGPLTDLGILYAQSHQRLLAINSLASAVAARPDNEVAQNWLGTLYRETGDALRAEQCYRAAIQARASYPQAHLNLAILYDVVLHRPREALAAYRDYQRVSGAEDLIVAAWIRDLESQLESPASPTPTTVAEARP